MWNFPPDHRCTGPSSTRRFLHRSPTCLGTRIATKSLMLCRCWSCDWRMTRSESAGCSSRYTYVRTAASSDTQGSWPEDFTDARRSLHGTKLPLYMSEPLLSLVNVKIHQLCWCSQFPSTFAYKLIRLRRSLKLSGAFVTVRCTQPPRPCYAIVTLGRASPPPHLPSCIT